MLPLKDENPVTRTPFVTIGILVACLWIYFVWQPSVGTSEQVSVDTPAGVLRMQESTAFNLEHAAIPCEIVSGRALTVDEAIATFGTPGGDGEHCGEGSSGSPRVFSDKSVWLSLLTSMFLHGSLLHLGGNLLFLWIFGNNIEDHLGHVRFAVFYLLAGVAASALHIALNLESTIPVVGASGAIAGVMGVYLVWFPRARPHARVPRVPDHDDRGAGDLVARVLVRVPVLHKPEQRRRVGGPRRRLRVRGIRRAARPREPSGATGRVDRGSSSRPVGREVGRHWGSAAAVALAALATLVARREPGLTDAGEHPAPTSERRRPSQPPLVCSSWAAMPPPPPP